MGGGEGVRLLGIIRRCRPTAGLSLGVKKVQCWSTIYKAGPTLVQHWVDVWC